MQDNVQMSEHSGTGVLVRGAWRYQVRAVCASVCQYVTFAALSM